MSVTDYSRSYAVTTASDQPTTLYSRIIKPTLDRLSIVLSLPFVLPLISILALVVMCDGHRPFYCQKRVGRGGRTFSILKLRTMIPDADARLETYLAENQAARDEWNATQKLKNDPRITLVGRLLRKTSLDELPQLWNVFVGNMSLVGPRPMMPCQKPMYPGSAYYRLKPGITGYWQISLRNGSDFARRAEFDASYEREMGFTTDVKVLVKTLSVVLRATGY